MEETNQGYMHVWRQQNQDVEVRGFVVQHSFDKDSWRLLMKIITLLHIFLKMKPWNILTMVANIAGRFCSMYE